eukprot:Colp12_sorted_trinity150504_noHs@10789
MVVATDVKHITPTQLYNAPLFEGFLVIDARHPNQYREGHISTAENFPPREDVEASLEDLLHEWIVNFLEEYGIENKRRVFIYDDGVEEYGSNHTQNVIGCLMRERCRTLLHREMQVSFVTGGYSRFFQMYPFLCNLENRPRFDRSTPAQVYDNLFLGSRLHAEDKELLNFLGITHIVNVTQNVPNYLAKEGFAYLRCPIEDSIHQPIKPSIETALRFIRACEAAGHKVLVHCEQGISRSASICTAFVLEKEPHLNVLAAIAKVRSARVVAHPNEGFVQQLEELYPRGVAE